MQSLFRRGAAALATVAALGCAAVAQAAPTNFSFTGGFTQANDVQTFTFTANGASAVRLITYSHAGGTQSNGNAVAAGASTRSWRCSMPPACWWARTTTPPATPPAPAAAPQ